VTLPCGRGGGRISANAAGCDSEIPRAVPVNKPHRDVIGITLLAIASPAEEAAAISLACD